MPDDGYEYLVGMKDEMAAPARHAASGLDELTGSLRRSETALKSHGAAHAESGRRVKEHEGFVKDFTSSLIPQIAAAELAAEAVKKIGEVGFETIKFAAEAGEFKEAAIDAYSVIQGTAEEGERTFRELDKTAREIHMPSEKAQQIAQQLMLEGLKGTEAVTDTIRAISDLQSVGLGAGAEKLQSIIARSEAAGHFTVKAKSLAGTGVDFNALALELGIGRKQLDAEIKAGTIDTEKGIAAIDAVITKGKIGELATKKFTISDAFTDLKNTIRGVFQETDSSPLTEALRRVSEEFAEGTEQGEKMREAVDEIMVAAGGMVDTLSEWGTAASNAADQALDAWEKTFDWMTAHNPLVSAEQKRDAVLRREIEHKERDLAAAARAQDKVEEEVLAAAKKGKSAAALRRIGAKGGLDVHAGDKEVAEMDAFEAARNRAIPLSAGDKRKMIAGTITRDDPSGGHHDIPVAPGDAAEKAAGDVGAAAADAMVKGAKGPAGFDAHSPSRKMFDIGVDAADGMKAGAAMASEPREAPAAAGGSTDNRRSLSVKVDVGGVHFTGHMDPEDFIPLLESQMADVFERVALELGQ